MISNIKKDFFLIEKLKSQKNKNPNPKKSPNHYLNKFIRFFIICLLLPLLSYTSSINFKLSYITLKIKGTGNKNIFCTTDSFASENRPDRVKINGATKTSVTSTYYLTETTNTVILYWDTNRNDYSHMFHGCKDIKEIDLTYFITSQVVSFASMFRECSSLTSINFANFDSGNANDMSAMFYECRSLTSIDLSNFDTSKVGPMWGMFANCTSLTSLDLSHLRATRVNYMWAMFSGCKLLTSLNLYGFDTSLVTEMGELFKGCVNLEYINLYNFKENRLTSQYSMFDSVPNNVVVCITKNNIRNKIYPELQTRECFSEDCSTNWKLSQNLIIKTTGACVTSCRNYNLNEYDNKCYSTCPSWTKSNGNNKCICRWNQCLDCSEEAYYEYLCNSCNTGYYKEENDPSNTGGLIACYKDPEGYYFDEVYSLYRKCYYTCKTCDKKGDSSNHNCLECKANIACMLSNYANVETTQVKVETTQIVKVETTQVPKVETTQVKVETTQALEKLYTTESLTEFKYIPEIKINTYKEMISASEKIRLPTNQNQDLIHKYSFLDLLTEINKVTRTSNETEYYDTIREIIETFFSLMIYDTINIDQGQEEKISIGKFQVALTTSENQRNYIYNNTDITNSTLIDLNGCEISLRSFYNISNDTLLYIKKTDVYQEGMLIPKVEYDVYARLAGLKLEQLNLSVCANDKINIFTSVNVTGNLDVLNSTSGYYTDICYQATSDSGTDMTLNDRKIEFVERNKTVCQDDCVFSGYNYTTKKAKCSCNVKEASFSFKDIYINKTKLYNNFLDIKSIANIDFLFCYKILFTKDGLLKNIGSYILLSLILLHIIFIFVFYKKDLPKLKIKIKDIFLARKNLALKKGDKSGKRHETRNDLNKKGTMNKQNTEINNQLKIPFNKTERKKLKKKQKKNKHNNLINTNNDKEIKIKMNKVSRNIINNNCNSILFNNIIGRNNIKRENRNKFSKVIKQNMISKFKNILDYNDEEINDLEYELAIISDERKYCQYYISLLKTKHDIFYSFCFNNDYNSKILKIDLFNLGFAISYIVNGLFFTDETMHNIYENEGSFDYIYQLPITVYSSLISMVLGLLFKTLALSNDAILDFKKSKSIKEIIKEKKKLEIRLKVKFVLYFILSFIFLLMFWYYIAMFCAVYKNTQYHLIQDTLISLGLSFIYPFWYNLIPGIFRIPALSNPKSKRTCLYKLSQILQIF